MLGRHYFGSTYFGTYFGPATAPAGVVAEPAVLDLATVAVAADVPIDATAEAVTIDLGVFPSPPSVVVPVRDADAYAALRRTLADLNIFEKVTIGRSLPDLRTTSYDRTAAHITQGRAETRPDGSPGREVRRCPFVLTILVGGEPDIDAAYNLLDRLEAHVRNRLLSRQARSLGGLAIPWETTLGQGAIDQSNHPKDQNRIAGRFAYATSLRDGYRETP